MEDAQGVSGVADEGDKLKFFKEEKEVLQLLDASNFEHDLNAMKTVINIVLFQLTHLIITHSLDQLIDCVE
jgi:hypothetical protein